jgi:1-acyl-sn-glycerol-3-phosphate acyltransferase
VAHRAEVMDMGSSGRSGRSASVPGSRSPARLALRPLLRAWLRLVVDGVDRVPETGPVIVASTHLSHADSIALGTGIRRPVHFVGDLVLTRWPVLGPLLPRLGMVPLRRGEADAHALAVLGELLRRGECVVVYPEASRSRDGRVHRLRSGTARLAAEHRVPVIPAAVLDTDRVWPIDGRPRVRGGKIRIVFGEPMAPPLDTPRARRAFNDELQRVLADLAGVEAADDYSPFHGGDSA